MQIASQWQDNLTASRIKDSQVHVKHLISFIVIEK